MIGLLVTGARVATRVAVHSHMAAQARADAFRAQVQSFPFLLTPKHGDAALYQDLRASFGHLVPGRPQLAAAQAVHGEPPADTVLWLTDAPIAVRYRLERPAFAATSAADLAFRTTEAYARSRAADATADRIEVVDPAWLAAWGVEAAARVEYDLCFPDAVGADREEVVVLVRAGMVLFVATRHARAAVDPVTLALFRSASEATMVWDPHRWQSGSVLWPESRFLEPRVVPTLWPARQEQIAWLSRELALAEPQRGVVLAAVGGLLRQSGPPWMPLAAAEWSAHRERLLAAAADPKLRTFVEAVFADVRTAHDVRGVALMVGRAVVASAPRS